MPGAHDPPGIVVLRPVLGAHRRRGGKPVVPALRRGVDRCCRIRQVPVEPQARGDVDLECALPWAVDGKPHEVAPQSGRLDLVLHQPAVGRVGDVAADVAGEAQHAAAAVGAHTVQVGAKAQRSGARPAASTAASPGRRIPGHARRRASPGVHSGGRSSSPAAEHSQLRR